MSPKPTVERVTMVKYKLPPPTTCPRAAVTRCRATRNVHPFRYLTLPQRLSCNSPILTRYSSGPQRPNMGQALPDDVLGGGQAWVVGELGVVADEPVPGLTVVCVGAVQRGLRNARAVPRHGA
eukprot:2223229-Rhodomonas_salina.1